MKLLDWIADKFGYEKKWSPERAFFGMTDVYGKEHFGMVVSHGYAFIDCDAFYVERDGNNIHMSADFKLASDDPRISLRSAVSVESGTSGSTLYLNQVLVKERNDAQ